MNYENLTRKELIRLAVYNYRKYKETRNCFIWDSKNKITKRPQWYDYWISYVICLNKYKDISRGF